MLTNFTSPVLNVSVDVLQDLDGSEALASLWFLFSRCQSSLNEGKRLENISWRLWSQQIAGHSLKYRPLTPDSPSESLSTHGSGSIAPLSHKNFQTQSPRQLIGKILCDFISNPQQLTQPLHLKLRLPERLTKAELQVQTASVLPTPAAELFSLSIIPPTDSSGGATATIASSNVSNATSQASGGSSSKSVSPITGSHVLSPQSNVSSSNPNTSVLASPFPLVVVVNPTPNPTPHPTPPATPVLPATLAPDAVGHTHVPLPQRMSPESPVLTRDRRQSNLALATALVMPEFQARSSALSGSRSPIHSNLLPPSPSANTSSSVASTFSTTSDSSHLTASSSTSIHSNDSRSLNATLKPSDARIFFLKHDEHSSGSSDEPSPVRPNIATFANIRSDAPFNRVQGVQTTTPGPGSYSTGIQNSNEDPIHPSKLTRQPSVGQGITGSLGEIDTRERFPHSSTVSKSNKSSGRGSSSGRTSGSSEGRSRSRSHGRAHDGLMMASRKKAHTSLVAGRRGTRSSANGALSQIHGQTRAQGQVASGDLLQFAPSGTSSALEQNRSEGKSTHAHGVVHTTPYPRRPAQVPLSMSSTTPGRRAMFNIGSQSPSGSPSNTDLSTSSQAHTRSPPINGGPSVNAPPLSPSGRMRSQGNQPLTAARAAPLNPPPNPSSIVNSRLPRGLPHATSNLSAAEAVIQAPRTKRVVLADDDDDDWDETETDLDSDFEDDRKSDIDAEKGGTLVEPGLIGGTGDNDEEGDWVSEEDDSGSGGAVSAAPSGKKTMVSPPAPPAPSENNHKRRPGVSRHQSQPDIFTTAAVSKQKQQPVYLGKDQQFVQAQPQQRSQYPPVPSRTSRRSDRDQATEPNLGDAALEAQRQREFFTKVPKRSYSNLSTRSQSGLLSQLMNPDPNIFPVDHPYRRGYSSGDVAVGGRTGNGLARVGMQPMINLTGNAEAKSHISNLTNAALRPSAARKASITSAASGAHPAVPSVSKVVPLRPTKSAVALPVANSVTASSYKEDLDMLADLGKGKGKERQRESSGTSGGYRPKGRPQDEEMEDESEDDREQAYHISKSVAEQKLAAFADRRSAKKGFSSSRAEPPPVLQLYPVPDPDLVPAPHRSQSQYVANTQEKISTPPVQVPLRLGFPYHLPPAAPPSSPHTTRQLMLRTEMSESFRQNLYWSRKVIKQEFSGPRRKSSSKLTGLQPLTAFPTVVHLTEKKKTESGGSNTQGVSEDRLEEDLMEAIRPGKMQRNRSWAGGGR